MSIFSHKPNDYLCPFCLIAKGVEHKNIATKQSEIICHNSDTTAFISSRQWPNNPGHVIVIPNDHYENVFDFPPEKASQIQKTILAVALAMKRVYSCPGISTRQHNEPAGDQDVWHYHVHVFPRYVNDRLYETHWLKMDPNERSQFAKHLRDAIFEN